LLPFSTLTALCFSAVVPFDLDSLASPLIGASSLTSLTVVHGDGSPTVYTQFLAAIPQTNLVHLDLDGTSADPLCARLSETKLVSLRLSECDIGESGLDKLVACLAQTKLTSLSIERDKFNAQSLSALLLALKHTQLSSLRLVDIFDDESLFSSDTLASVLPECPSLNYLSLSDCGLTNDDAKVLSPVLARSRLTCLDLSHNRHLDYSGAIALIKGLKSSSIRHLNLSYSACVTPSELHGLLDSLKALVRAPLSSDGSIDASVCSSLCSLPFARMGPADRTRVSEALLIRPS
jgi:hypothetical protein